MKNEIENEFEGIHNRLRLLGRKYNSENENLHFTALKCPDAELYSTLVSFARGGLKIVQKHREYFLQNSLYDDGMFWYDLFLLASSAALGVRNNKAQKSIPETEMRSLAEVLVEISEFSTLNAGDIRKRNYEALGNTLYAFYSEDLINLVRRKGESMGQDSVINFILRTVGRVREIIQKEESKAISK
jgi:hypothetical protein